MKKMAMIVYNQLKTDARVLRAADALKKEFDITLIGLGDGTFSKDGVRVVEFSLTKKIGMLKYTEFCQKVIKYLKRIEYEILYAHDFYSAIFVDLANRKNKRMVYDAHELFIPQNGVKMSLRDKFYYQLEKKAIKKADKLICALSERGEVMKGHFNLKACPHVVRNISVLQVYDDENSRMLTQQCREFFKKAGSTLVYAGALTRGRRLEKLFELVRWSKNNIKVLIIGSGEATDELKTIAEKEIPKRYFFTGNIPYAYMGVLLEKCDIGFLNYPATNLNNTYCASNKIYEYASVGLPMIAGYNPTLKKILEENQIGMVEDQDADNLGECLDWVIAHLEDMKKNCADFIICNTWEKEAESLKHYLKDLE